MHTRLALDAWEAFTKKLPVVQLGPLVSQIVYTVLPWLDRYPTRVVAILQYMVVENDKTYAKRGGTSEA